MLKFRAPRHRDKVSNVVFSLQAEILDSIVMSDNNYEDKEAKLVSVHAVADGSVESSDGETSTLEWSSEEEKRLVRK